MAFLAKAAMRSGVMRSGAMGSGMGDAGASQASEALKKVKKLLGDIESGKMPLDGSSRKLLEKLGIKGGDISKLLDGKSGGFKEFGIKPIDLSRNGVNEKDGIKLEKPEKASEKEISFKSRVNGSFNSIKADYYDKSRIFDTKNVDRVPTYTPKPGTNEVRLEGRPLEGDIKNLENEVKQGLKDIQEKTKNLINDVEKGMGKEFGEEFGKNLENIDKDIEKLRKNIENGKDFSKDLENLEKDTDKLEKNMGEKEDTGENEFSTDTKSFFHKLKDVTEVLKQYERIAGEDTKAIDNLQVVEGLGEGLSTDSVGSPRLNRAHQNAKKGGIKHESFSQTSTGSDSGAHNPTGGGPTRLKQDSKTGGYDPSRGKVSGDGPGKPFDPVRKQVKRLKDFYDRHENEFDFMDSVNQQANQAAGNIDNVVGGALMAYARKELEEGLGENVPVGDGESQNNNNNNNNGSNSLIGDKLKGKPEKDHKDLETTKDVVPHKTGVKGGGGKASVGHSLEGANSHHATDTLKKENSIKDLFKRMHDLNKNPYVKVVSGTSDQLRNVQDPTGEIFAELAAKFGVSVSPDDNVGQQNNNNGMGDIFSSKEEKSHKGKTPKRGSERSKLEHHANSQVSHTNVPKLEHSSHSARIELAKGKAEEPTPEGKSEVFGKGVDQTHHDPLKRDHQILEQKEGSNKERGSDTKRELVEAETALEIEGEKKAMDKHNIEEAIVTVRAIKDVEEFFGGNDSKDQNEKKEIENAEQRDRRQVEREEQRREIEELAQVSELSVKEEAVKGVEEKMEQRREGREEGRGREEKLVAEKLEQSREEVEGKREQEEKEEQERLVAGRMERSREAIADKKEQEEEKKEKERLIAGRMEKSREVPEEKMEQRRKEVERVVQRQEKAIELEEIQTRLEEVQGEAQLNVEQADQVNPKAAYSEQLVEQADQIQLQEGEISEREREVVGPEEVTAKLERIVQANEEEGGKKGKVVGPEEVTAKLERIVQADEGLVERDEPIAQERSQSSEISEIAVTNSVSDKDPEGYEKRGRNGNSKTVEQLKRPEEAKNLASEHTEPSEKESETEKAARLEKDNFVGLFTGVAKPGPQTDIARKFGENVYREAKAGKEDIGDLTRSIVENSEKFTKDFTRYLQVEEEKIGAESSIDRQLQNEAQIREGIPAS